MKDVLLFFVGITNLLIAIFNQDRKWSPFLILGGFICMYFAFEAILKTRVFKKRTNGEAHLKDDKLEAESRLVKYLRTELDLTSDAYSLMSTDFELQKIRLANAELALQNRFEIRNFQVLMDETGVFADSVFGKRPYSAALYSLKSEIDEAIMDGNAMEFADMWIALLDATRVRGYSATLIYDTSIQKLQINWQRKWLPPDANGVVHHIEQ